MFYNNPMLTKTTDQNNHKLSQAEVERIIAESISKGSISDGVNSANSSRRPSHNDKILDQNQAFASIIKAMADQSESILRLTEHNNFLEQQSSKLRGVIAQVTSELTEAKTNLGAVKSEAEKEAKEHLFSKETIKNLNERLDKTKEELEVFNKPRGIIAWTCRSVLKNI